MNLYLSTIKQIVTRFPAVIPHLKGRARWIYHMGYTMKDVQGVNAEYVHWHVWEDKEPIYFQYKTYDFMLRQIEGLVNGVYAGNVQSEFITIMGNLITGQLTQAYTQAWEDEGGEGALPDYLNESLETMILGQFDHVDKYYLDIVNARELELPIDPLLSRAELWANQWQSAYEEAVHLITLNNGGKEEWVLGETEEHCETCSSLNGIVAFASEWDELDVYPQGAPNEKLDCGGWRCDCSRQPTDKRRSRGAYDKISSIVKG